MKLGVTLDILNQKATPAFYADTLANRPAAGYVGRVFISTDTLDLYRDTGTTWVLLSPSSTGTITGSGAAGQVTYFSAASSITGSNDLFFDSVNGHLGIGTITPSTALTIFHDQNQIIQINQTTATNDTKIAFQNSGTPLWRIGNSYNAGANDYAIYDVVGAIQPLTIKKTTGQVLIGTTSVGTGKLVVVSATSDNGIQIVGATAPSLRIDNAETAPTKRIGLAIATNTNNFIQGSSDRDMCIFNGSTTASPILFGIYDAAAVNVQEAARISAARNFLIGTTTDAGQKLQVSGTALITGAATFSNSVGINGVAASYPLYVRTGTNQRARFVDNGGLFQFAILNDAESAYSDLSIGNSALIVKTSNNVLIGTTTDAGQKLQVNGTGQFASTLKAFCPTTTNQSGLIVEATAAGAGGSQPGVLFNDNSSVSKYSLYLDVTSNTLNFGNSAGTIYITIKSSGVINLQNVPTSAAGLVSGDIYRTANVLNIVP